jgi:hypothetical protein
MLLQTCYVPRLTECGVGERHRDALFLPFSRRCRDFQRLATACMRPPTWRAAAQRTSLRGAAETFDSLPQASRFNCGERRTKQRRTLSSQRRSAGILDLLGAYSFLPGQAASYGRAPLDRGCDEFAENMQYDGSARSGAGLEHDGSIKETVRVARNALHKLSEVPGAGSRSLSLTAGDRRVAPCTQNECSRKQSREGSQ